MIPKVPHQTPRDSPARVLGTCTRYSSFIKSTINGSCVNGITRVREGSRVTVKGLRRRNTIVLFVDPLRSTDKFCKRLYILLRCEC